MTTDYSVYHEQMKSLIRSASSVKLSNIKPSDWTEQNVVMDKPRPGPFSYWNTPYCRGLIDMFAPDHPMRWLAVMKGAQIGLSAGVIIPVLLWMIKNDPSNTYFLVGSPNLVEKATEKLDLGIDRAGLRPYIKPQVQRRRNQKSGDTNDKKEFSGGYIHIGSANNHKDIRDVSLKYGLFDDWEAVKMSSKESGSTRKLLEQRFAAYDGVQKIGYISTPELAAQSNITEAYEMGDKRKYFVPAPCCGAMIEILWHTHKNGITGGIHWERDESTGLLIPGTVGYRCQECSEKFYDTEKMKMLNAGDWHPTAKPKKIGFYSAHISSLYAPTFMYGWEHYVNDWIDAHPIGQPRIEHLYKTFVTVALGEGYEEPAEELKATAIMGNTRDYQVFEIPEKQSIADGNGEIVLLTMTGDLNGTVKGVAGALVDDARLDWQMVAHSESGATYNVAHGSIGTFIPRENSLQNKIDREKWTYDMHVERSVWTVYDEISRRQYVGDNGTPFSVIMPAIDCGAYKDKAEAYIDWTIGQYPENPCVGVRGNKEEKYTLQNANVAMFLQGKYRNDVYFLQVGMFKDKVAASMRAKWDPMSGIAQPPTFMNFPQPKDGLYGFSNFFEHFESEERSRVEDDDGAIAFRWQKKKSHLQNHQFDCYVYNIAMRDIQVWKVGKELGMKEFQWVDYCNYVLDK